MSRRVMTRFQSTRQGQSFVITLYDDRGRRSLRAAVPTLDAYWAEQISEYLRSGRLTGMAQQATHVGRDALV